MKIKEFLVENIELFILPAIVTVLTFILSLLNVYWGILGIVGSIFSIFFNYDIYVKKQTELKEYVDKLELSFTEITKNAIFSMPFPIFITNGEGKIIWYNSKFKEISMEKQGLADYDIKDIIINFPKKFSDLKNSFVLKYGLNDYEIFYNEILVEKQKQFLFYMVNITDFVNLKEKHEANKLVHLNIRFDNYDEIYSQTPSERRPIVFAQMDRIITSYIHEYGGFIKKSEKDKYTILLLKKNFDEIVQNKFKFIDMIREIKSGNSIPPTLSIGVGMNESNPKDLEKSASIALDIALGRGGDQVVIKNGESLEYFGGKSKATEKRTKVRARVIAHALGQLIEKSSNVFVMGHQNPDMDSFGSALGITYAVMRKQKEVYMVLDKVTPAIKNVYNLARFNLKGFTDIVISPDEAVEKISSSSLIIITDNHRRNSVEEPRLFNYSSNVVVIDHHRRGKDYIDNATLSYMEPYASSASELVTEMLMYMEGNVEIHKSVAEALLAGITVDTKNFFYQTGVRTFEAASVLKRYGADSITVKQLFKDDLEIIRYKSEIISKSFIYKNGYIVGVFDLETPESTLVASQAADELLNIEGVLASFVLTKSKGKTHISARSLGEVSVQLIMEKIGGGGHLTVAATQLEFDIDKSIDILKNAIDNYLEEEK